MALSETRTVVYGACIAIGIIVGLVLASGLSTGVVVLLAVLAVGYVIVDSLR